MSMEIEDLWEDENPAGEQPVNGPAKKDTETPEPGEHKPDNEEEEFTDLHRDAEDQKKDPKEDDGHEEDEEDDDPDEGNADKDKGADDTPSVDVLEAFLEEFNVVGGIIEFEDGKKEHISKFDAKTQLEILKEVVKQSAPEPQSDISPEERQFLEDLRKQRPVEDVISDLVNQRLSELQVAQEIGGWVDYASVEDDAMFKMYLKDQFADMSDEEIQEELEIAKEGKSYQKSVDAIRENYTIRQEARKAEWLAERAEKAQQARNQEVQRIVADVAAINEVGGWKVDDETKNKVIAKMVEVDENGDSEFIREVMGDPKKMFMAQWYLDNAEKMFEQMDKYYKDEIRKMQKANAPASKKTPKVSITKPTKEQPAKEQNKSKSTAYGIDDLYD